VVTSQNVNRHLFAEAPTHGFPAGSVLVRSSATQRNIQFRERTGTSTPVSLGGGERITLRWLFRCNDKVERPVEPPLGGAQPFYLDVYSPPLGLHELTVPLADRLEVNLPAVAESQARPQHGGTVAP
jgi:hypothetical protein